MAGYEILFKESVFKDLQVIPKTDLRKILSRIERLADDPRPAGSQKLTDEPWVEPFRVLAKWAPYLGDGFEAQTYPDSQNLFTLGRAAIYPAGSWEISLFNTAGLKLGAFPENVAAYWARVQARDGYQRAIAKEAGAALFIS